MSLRRIHRKPLRESRKFSVSRRSRRFFEYISEGFQDELETALYQTYRDYILDELLTRLYDRDVNRFVMDYEDEDRENLKWEKVYKDLERMLYDAVDDASILTAFENYYPDLYEEAEKADCIDFVSDRIKHIIMEPRKSLDEDFLEYVACYLLDIPYYQ